MNSSKTNEILKNMDTTMDTISSETTILKNYLKGISTDVGSIETDVSKNKKYFFSKLTYNGNEYLGQSDYSSNNIVGGYFNNLNDTLFVNKFKFSYASTGTATTAGMYHSSNFTTKIGKYDSDFDEQYITIDTNVDHAREYIRRNYFDTNIHDFTYSFSENPIEIPVGITFAHSISGDFSTGYSSNAVGIIEGHYFE